MVIGGLQGIAPLQINLGYQFGLQLQVQLQVMSKAIQTILDMQLKSFFYTE